ncbi:aromatic-amino-acid aminotransferase 1 [Scenedesmus sp. PABB004]|nr:aromatic-amino-acid aminotransferase 1 [Scenedesmus sp. PABB004]
MLLAARRLRAAAGTAARRQRRGSSSGGGAKAMAADEQPTTQPTTQPKAMAQPTTQLSEFTQRQLESGVIDFSAGQPGPPLLRAAMDIVAAASAHRFAGPAADPFLLQYGPEAGYASFRASLAAFLSEASGAAVDPEELLVTAGVSHGLDLAARQLASPGDVVLVEQPTYFLAGAILRQAGLQLVPVPTCAHGLDVAALEELLAARRAAGAAPPALLYTIPVHNNPTGATLPARERERLVRLARTHGFTILADEVYQLLTFPDAPPPPLPLRAVEADLLARGGATGAGRPEPRVVSLGSFSKILAPGMRLGWMEAAPGVLRRVRRDGVLGSGGSIAPLASGIAHSALELGLLSAALRDVVRPALAQGCAALCEALAAHLPGAAFEAPHGGYFVWVTLPRGVCARELLALAAARHGVRFVPGAVCEGGDAHAGSLRLSFAFYAPDELRAGVARLAAALAEYEAGGRAPS